MFAPLFLSLYLIAIPIPNVSPIKPWIATVPLVTEHDMKAHAFIIGEYYTRRECLSEVDKFNQDLIQHKFVIRVNGELVAGSPKHLARCMTDMVED